MRSNITPEQFAKLPKFAREYITELERDLKDSTRILDEAFGAIEPTRISVEHGGYGKDSRKRYIKDDERVRFVLSPEDGWRERGNSVAIHITDEDTLEIMGDDSLLVFQQSGNVVLVKMRQFWKV